MGTPIEPSGDVQGVDSGTPGQNPAWNDVLSVIPQELHQQVTPHFQQWDQAAQSRIENVNNTFKDFQPLIDNGIGYSDVEQSLQLMYQLNTNPQGFLQALTEAYGNQQPQGQQNPEPVDNGFQDPRFDEFASQQQQLQQGLDLVAQTILQQQEAKMAAEADAEIDSELAQLKEKHPNISEEFALSLMVNGFDINQVGEHWNAISQGILQQNPRPFAPSVMGMNGGGTGLPSQAIDPKSLNGVDRRALVARMAQLGTQD